MHSQRSSQSTVQSVVNRPRAPSLAGAFANHLANTNNGQNADYQQFRASAQQQQALPNALPGVTGSPVSPDQSYNSRGSISGIGQGNANTGSAGTGRGTSSKSVLTVALQKANSAVLLDQAGNFPAAIAAYQQSIRMLREVMDRVDESAANWKAREGDRALARMHALTSESEAEMQERIKREDRMEKREKARLEEARRLRVIVGCLILSNFVQAPI